MQAVVDRLLGSSPFNLKEASGTYFEKGNFHHEHHFYRYQFPEIAEDFFRTVCKNRDVKILHLFH